MFFLRLNNVIGVHDFSTTYLQNIEQSHDCYMRPMLSLVSMSRLDAMVSLSLIIVFTTFLPEFYFHVHSICVMSHIEILQKHPTTS